MVVAVQAERSAECGGILGVLLAANESSAVWAYLVMPAHVAWLDFAVGGVDYAGVHRAEARCGESGEDGWVAGDGLGDAFASDDAGFD